MKNELTFKNIVILGMCVYLITVAERMIGNDQGHSAKIVEYEREKLQMQEDKQVLTDKIYEYEVNRIKKNAFIDGASNAELDSLESVHNPR